MKETGHVPVLYRETLTALELEPGNIIIDGTLGGGGHARGILEAVSPNGRLIGIDRDAAAIERCRERLDRYRGMLTLVHDDFKNVRKILDSLAVQEIDGAVLDLGVSSFQLDEGERGFSYQADADEMAASSTVDKGTQNAAAEMQEQSPVQVGAGNAETAGVFDGLKNFFADLMEAVKGWFQA